MRQKEWEKNSIKNPGIAVMVDKYEAGVQPNVSGVGVWGGRVLVRWGWLWV